MKAVRALAFGMQRSSAHFGGFHLLLGKEGPGANFLSTLLEPRS